MHKAKGIGSALMYDGAYAQEQYLSINLPGAVTNDLLVSAVSGYKIRVISYSISNQAVGAISTIFRRGSGGGTTISSTITLPINGNISEKDKNGLFETTAGSQLGVQHSGDVGVRITYILVN